MFTPELANELARIFHEGQVDKQGRDYFTAHVTPIAMMARALGPEYEIVAWLHDVIEDTPANFALLRAFGMPNHLLEALFSVTRRKGETYMAFIMRACRNDIGREVKILDNEHNIVSAPSLAHCGFPEMAERMLAKRYLPARDLLIAARTQRLVLQSLQPNG